MLKGEQAGTNQTALSLPDLSDVVKNQLADVLADIQEMNESGFRTYDLLTMIGTAVRGLGKEEAIPDLEFMNIQNAATIVKRSIQYSKSWRLWIEALYHVLWIVVWTVAVMYRSQVYACFHAGPMLHTVIVGVISGAVGASLRALGALYIHRIHLDLNEHFTMWYVLKPMVGGVMGGFVALMAGMLLTGVGGSGSSPAVVLLSAFGGMHEEWAMGLFQKYTVKILGKDAPSVDSQKSVST